LHIGPVTYGNIGSPDRLDFTVVGPTVNVVSRLEAIAKSTNCPAVCSREIAALLPPEAISPLGAFALKGVSDGQTIFKLLAPKQHT
jgi:adenylate cyclase